MKKTINFSVLLVSIFIFSAFTISKDKSYELKLNLSEGDKFYVLTTSEQNITQSMMGTEIKIAQTIIMGYDYEVLEVLDNGDYKTKVTYTRVAYQQDSQYVTVDYDSDNPDAEVNAQTQAFAALKGSSFVFVCDSKGNVIDLEGLDKLLADMLEATAKDLPLEKRAEVEKTLKSQFGDKAMKSTLSNTMNIYPDKKIKKGDSWNRVINLNVGMPMKLDNTWTLVEVKKGLASVSVHSEIESIESAEPMKVQGMTMEYNLSGEQEGVSKLNISTGLVEESVINQKIKGTMVMSGEMLPQAMEVPIAIETKATVTMVKK